MLGAYPVAMSVGPSHPACFVFDGRLYVVPSGSDLSVSETARALRSLSAIELSGPTPPGGAAHWVVTGAVGGGVAFAVIAAAGGWHVTALLSLLLCFTMGALVGALLAAGTHSLVGAATGEGQAAPRASHAVEVPEDVASSAPDDSTGDELVLWSTLVSRYRRADATASGAEHLEAARDYETVARLLGLPPGRE